MTTEKLEMKRLARFCMGTMIKIVSVNKINMYSLQETEIANEPALEYLLWSKRHSSLWVDVAQKFLKFVHTKE